MKKIFFAFLVLALSISATTAVINSRDWQDVYSALVYSRIKGYEPRFLASTPHADYLHDYLPEGDIVVIESEVAPWVFNYAGVLEDEGLNVIETIKLKESGNLELAVKSGLKNWVVVDSTYGYNAISVAPYAVNSPAFVVFANKDNFDQVKGHAESIGVTNSLLYGQLDEEVVEAFSGSERINEGNRFSNNVEILKRIDSLIDSNQIYLTHGEILEMGLITKDFPIVLIGIDNAPEQQKNYLQNAGYKVGIVLGNELYNNAKRLKDAGVLDTILIRYGQGLANTNSFYNEVRGLDIMSLPTYDLNISIPFAYYNTETRQLELVMRNNADKQITFSKNTITLTAGETQKFVGDDRAIYLRGNTDTAVAYDVDLNAEVSAGNLIKAEVRTLYGEDSKALEKILNTVFDPVEVISVRDDSTIRAERLVYSAVNEELTLIASSETTAFTQVRIEVQGEVFETSGEPKQVGESIEIVFDGVIEKEEGLVADVFFTYGSRENMLLKQDLQEVEVEYAFEVEAWWIILLILLIIILALIYDRYKNREDKALIKNNVKRKKRKK